MIALLAGLFFFLVPMEEDPVSRARIPAAEPPLEPPLEPPSAGGGPGGGREASRTTRGGIRVGIFGREKEALRGRLGQIAETYPGRYGVMVLDPSTGETVSMGPDERFLAASLNKLPVLMTLYRSAAAGDVDLDDEISMQASDVQAYGTGSLYTRPVGYTMTLRECAGYMIKESDNTAWKMLDRYLGRDNIRSEISRVGARSTEYWIPNTTTPNDVMMLLEKISDPSYTSPDLSDEMLDVMTDTSFEDRLPQPLPKGTRVSHKIGSYESTFADAGVVFLKSPRKKEESYFMVVLVSDTGEGTARAAMQDMSLAAYRTFTGSGP